MPILDLRAVQFFSRQFSREDYVVPKAILTTKEGWRLEGYLKIQFGSPLLVGACEGTKVRPNYAQPWEPQEGPSAGAFQWFDPYAEIRWPSYALANFRADITPAFVDKVVTCDVLHRMRTLISFEIFQLSELTTMTDQVLHHDGYRYEYWTQGLDAVCNPVPAQGKYANADRDERVGPGHASSFAVRFGNSTQMHSLALVWSQAFSFPNRTTAQADETAIRRRAQEIKRHYNSNDELARAENDLRQYDVKGCIRSAAAAVEAVLRYYCAE